MTVQRSHDVVLDWMTRFTAEMAARRDELGALDTPIGDGDHGTNMDRGMRTAMDKLAATEPADGGAVLKTVAMALVSSVGGAAGPLYGTFFLQLASGLGAASELDHATWTGAWQKALQGVQARGKAEVGDATLVDALEPAVRALAASDDLSAAAHAATLAAKEGMESTTPLVARKGRASYLGDRSVGHQDPGATSMYHLIRSAEDALTA